MVKKGDHKRTQLLGSTRNPDALVSLILGLTATKKDSIGSAPAWLTNLLGTLSAHSLSKLFSELGETLPSVLRRCPAPLSTAAGPGNSAATDDSDSDNEEGLMVDDLRMSSSLVNQTTDSTNSATASSNAATTESNIAFALAYIRAITLICSSFLVAVEDRADRGLGLAGQTPSADLLIQQLGNLLMPLHAVAQTTAMSASADSPALAAAAAVTNEVSVVCEQSMTMERPESEKLAPQTIVYLLVQSYITNGRSGEVTRLYQNRQALGLLDLDDEQSSQTIISLISHCANSNSFRRVTVGRKFLGHAFGLGSPSLLEAIHSAAKLQFSKANKTHLDQWADVYFRGWQTSFQAGPEHARLFEQTCLIELVKGAVFAAKPVISAACAQVLVEGFHKRRSKPGVEAAILECYAPIVWRSLHVTNPLVRRNAGFLFAQAFPIVDRNDDASTRTRLIQEQLSAMEQLLTDSVPSVRAVAATGTCRALALFWTLPPTTVSRGLLARIVTDLAADSSSSLVRATALDGLAEIVRSVTAPDCHASLKALLPDLQTLIHDKVERVRTAFAGLLRAVTDRNLWANTAAPSAVPVSMIKYMDVAPTQHILARIPLERPQLAAQFASVLLQTVWPERSMTVTMDHLVERAELFMFSHKSNFAGLVKFYEIVATSGQRDEQAIAQLICALLGRIQSWLAQDVGRDHQKLDTAPVDRKRRRRRRAGDDDGDENAEQGSPVASRNAAEPDRLIKIGGFLQLIAVLWKGLRPDPAAAPSDVERNVLFHSVASDAMFQLLDDQLWPCRPHEARVLVQLAAWLPADELPQFASRLLPRLATAQLTTISKRNRGLSGDSNDNSDGDIDNDEYGSDDNDDDGASDDGESEAKAKEKRFNNALLDTVRTEILRCLRAWGKLTDVVEKVLVPGLQKGPSGQVKDDDGATQNRIKKTTKFISQLCDDLLKSVESQTSLLSAFESRFPALDLALSRTAMQQDSDLGGPVFLGDWPSRQLGTHCRLALQVCGQRTMQQAGMTVRSASSPDGQSAPVTRLFRWLRRSPLEGGAVATAAAGRRFSRQAMIAGAALLAEAAACGLMAAAAATDNRNALDERSRDHCVMAGGEFARALLSAASSAQGHRFRAVLTRHLGKTAFHLQVQGRSGEANDLISATIGLASGARAGEADFEEDAADAGTGALSQLMADAHIKALASRRVRLRALATALCAPFAPAASASAAPSTAAGGKEIVRAVIRVCESSRKDRKRICPAFAAALAACASLSIARIQETTMAASAADDQNEDQEDAESRDQLITGLFQSIDRVIDAFKLISQHLKDAASVRALASELGAVWRKLKKHMESDNQYPQWTRLAQRCNDLVYSICARSQAASTVSTPSASIAAIQAQPATVAT